jgi:3-oxoadipate enol-lactonase
MRADQVKVIVSGAELHYEVAGNVESRPIVLIHGFPFSHEMWQSQVELLRSEFRVISYDVRGHGSSAVGDGQYMLEFFVDDLIALLDHLKIDKTTVCGLSMGGYIALRSVERNPERFSAMVLCDTSPEADTNEAKLRRAASIMAAKREGVKAFAETLLKTVFAPESLRKRPDAVQTTRRSIESNSSTGICGTLLALASRTETTSSLFQMILPTLILVGELDKLTPPSISQMMQSKLPNSELYIIPGAAHLSNLENPAEFNKHLLEFLKHLS